MGNLPDKSVTILQQGQGGKVSVGMGEMLFDGTEQESASLRRVRIQLSRQEADWTTSLIPPSFTIAKVKDTLKGCLFLAKSLHFTRALVAGFLIIYPQDLRAGTGY